MGESINRLMVWPDKPMLREEQYKSKPARPNDLSDRTIEQPVVPVSAELEAGEVIDEPTVARTVRLLGGTAVEKA